MQHIEDTEQITLLRYIFGIMQDLRCDNGDKDNL